MKENTYIEYLFSGKTINNVDFNGDLILTLSDGLKVEISANGYRHLSIMELENE